MRAHAYPTQIPLLARGIHRQKTLIHALLYCDLGKRGPWGGQFDVGEAGFGLRSVVRGGLHHHNNVGGWGVRWANESNNNRSVGRKKRRLVNEKKSTTMKPKRQTRESRGGISSKKGKEMIRKTYP